MMSLKKSLIIAVFSLIVLSSLNVCKVEALDDSNSPPFFLSLQLEVFSIDLKTETVYTSNYEFMLKARDPSISNFTAVILKPHFYEAALYHSGNETGTPQIYDYLKISELKPLEVNRWFLTRKLCYPPFGCSFDDFELSFLMAVNMSTRLELNYTRFVMPISLQGDWEYQEHPSVIKLAGPPDNQTLIAHGFNPNEFYRYNGNHMTDFYLITETLKFKNIQSWRIALAYFAPPISILIISLVSAYRFKRLRLTHLLTLFLSVGLFTFTLLVSLYQYAPSKILTWPEILLYIAFGIVSVLAIIAVASKKEEERALFLTS